MTFARTKIKPPRPRSGAPIGRPALDHRLTQALLTRRLVLVCAAAGFGKTSALACQAEQLPSGTAFAWLACDEADTPTLLLECLVAALEPFDLPWRTSPEALVRAAVEARTPAQRRALAAELINALDACDVPHGVIVIDDFHRVGDPLVFEFVDTLLERFTPRWTLCIASRHAPPLTLGRLRAMDEVAEFGFNDLRFDPGEARELAARLGVAADDADLLHERTHGWPVGLRLGLGGPHGQASTALQANAIDRHVFDYLASEVIDRLDAELREFLLTTSVLPELTVARCAALSGDAQAAARLDQIERAGLFVTVLADEERTLRLHDLFREALQVRFEHERPQQFAAVLARAAATEVDPLRRVVWLQRAGAWDAAEAALTDDADALIASGAAAAVHGLFERFPPQRRAASARMQMLLARVRWDWDTAIDTTAHAAATFADEGDPVARLVALSYHCVALAGANRGDEVRALSQAVLAEPNLPEDALTRTLSAAAWVGLSSGDQREVAPQWARLLATLERSDDLARWTECAPLPPCIGMPGLRPLLQRYVDGALRCVPEHPTPLRGICHVMQGWLHLWAGDVDAAQASATAAIDDSRWLARPTSLDAPSRSLQAVLLAVRGDGSLSAQMLAALMAQIRASGVIMRIEVYLPLYSFLAMRCAGCVDDADWLREMAGQLVDAAASDRSWVSPRQRAGAAARLAELDGRLDEACDRWRAMLADAQHADLYGQVADTRLRLADALLRGGGPRDQAAAVLQPWFEQVRASGEWGAVLLSEPALLTRLAAADWQQALGDAEQAQLLAWSHAARAAAGASGDMMMEGAAALRGAASTTLTARELEVLGCIAAGDSNKVIARALELSPHTVKRHVANILDKLGLVSRGQAASWYRDQA